jgi:hypothetical protein
MKVMKVMQFVPATGDDPYLSVLAHLVEALPATAVVYQMFGALVARGRGELDHASLLTLVEDLSRHETT